MQRSGLSLMELARALASSPFWRETPGASLLVRGTPNPALGVVGRFDAAAERRLLSLSESISRSLRAQRYVDYPRVERDCELLAARLVEHFGRDELRRFRFAAIPRGGHIVLGMLAYALDLDQSQLEPPHPGDAPLVVVDDCSLTGSRFGRFLRRRENGETSENREIVFAHLYSHPGLRAAVEAREPSVLACLAAGDLTDRAPERLGAGYEAWRQRLLGGDDSRYWVGQIDSVAFPWNEPDKAFWNPVTGRMERGANLVPPELCLKNRPREELVSIRVQPEAVGPLRPAPRVLYGEYEERIVVGDLETGDSFSLCGVAAEMWSAIAGLGSLEAAAEALANEYDVAPEILREDLHGFAQDLLHRGLLENVEARAAVC